MIENELTEFVLTKLMLQDCSPYALPGILAILGHHDGFSPEEQQILHDAFDKVVATDDIYEGHKWEHAE